MTFISQRPSVGPLPPSSQPFPCVYAWQVLDRLLEQTDNRRETFAKLAMANLHAYSAPTDRRKPESVKRAEVHYSHAMELYRRVLEKDEGVFLCCSLLFNLRIGSYWCLHLGGDATQGGQRHADCSA